MTKPLIRYDRGAWWCGLPADSRIWCACGDTPSEALALWLRSRT